MFTRVRAHCPQLRIVAEDLGDITPEVTAFAETLEAVCIDAVESGEMTKDLAILISRDAPYLNTEDFLDVIDRRLQARMSTRAS